MFACDLSATGRDEVVFRKAERERRAAADGSVRRDRTAVALHDARDGREADAGAGELGVGVQPRERLEQPRRVRWAISTTCLFNIDQPLMHASSGNRRPFQSGAIASSSA
jgi:hypothetical protein